MSKFTVKFFTALCALSSLAFAQNYARRNPFMWKGPSETVIYGALIAAGVIGLAIIIAAIVQTRNKKKSIKDYINVQFAQKAREAGLNVAEQTLLRSITWTVAPQMFSDVFNSLVIFENAVDVELMKLIRTHGEDGQKTRDTVQTITLIRKKLGFNKIGEKAIESTRNIEFGQGISLFNPSGDTLIGNTKLLSNNELYFEADFAKLNNFQRNRNENTLIAKLTRNQDATYTIPVPIRSINYDEHVISFYHSTALERHQSRKYARIPVDIPIQCKIIKRVDDKLTPGAGADLDDAALIDISGGGLAFTANEMLSPEDIVMLTFVLEKQKFAMKAKIVAISAQDGKRNVYYRHRVVFYSPKPSDTERIIKFIFDKQREKIKMA